MLALAKKRIDHHGWRNVELVQTDAPDYRFPQNVNGILSTFDRYLRHVALIELYFGFAHISVGERSRNLRCHPTCRVAN